MAKATDARDLRLAQALAAGDQRAARRLCEEYLPRLLAYVTRRSGLDADAAAEAAQETLVAALRTIQHFRGESSLDTWLCAIARRKVADWYRVASQRPLSLDALTAEGLALMDERALPDEVAERDEMAASVHLAVWGLPPDQREAVLLKYLDDRPVADIAAELNRSEKAVESLLSRGRATLRKRLAVWGRSGSYGRRRGSG